MLRRIMNSGIRDILLWQNSFAIREKVNGLEGLKSYINKYNDILNIGISISFEKNGKKYCDIIPFDFDASNIEYALLDALKLFNILKMRNIMSYIAFSGGKGFHVCIISKPFKNSNVLNLVQMMFIKMLKLNTADKHIVGDFNRIVRVPGTGNIKANTYSFIIDEVYGLPLEPKDIEVNHKINIENGNRCKINKLRPCIEKEIKSENPSHIIRFAYVCDMISIGVSNTEILNNIKSFNWRDFDEEYTLYQINHIRNKKYLSISCKTLESMGYCINDCPLRILL